MIKKTAVVVLLALWGACAHADLFTDRATFNVATHTAYTEGFESLPLHPFAGPITFASGLTVSSPVMLLTGVAPSAVGNTSQALAEAATGGPQRGGIMFPVELHLGGLYSSFGLDLFENYGNNEQTSDFLYTLDFFNSGNQIASSDLVAIAANTGSFVGFTGSNCTLPWNNQLCTFDTVGSLLAWVTRCLITYRLAT